MKKRFNRADIAHSRLDLPPDVLMAHQIAEEKELAREINRRQDRMRRASIMRIVLGGAGTVTLGSITQIMFPLSMNALLWIGAVIVALYGVVGIYGHE